MNGDTPGDAPGQGAQQQPASSPPPAGQWQYTPSGAPNAPYQPVDGSSGDGFSPQNAGQPAELEWTASEFIQHSKSATWYVALGLVGLVVTVGAYLVSQHIVVAILVLAIIVIFGVAANRPPRVLTYRIVPSGVFVGAQFYPFSEYKSFSVVDEGAFSNITFWPMKRFGFPVGLYYDPSQEERIIATLANHLPLQPHQTDMVERVMRRIRF